MGKNMNEGRKMLMEVYYEHYMENCMGRYWEEEKYIHYMVNIHDKNKREKFRRFFESESFTCVDWNPDYTGVLVNIKLRRFALIYMACRHSCVDERPYTPEEFMDEVYNKKDVMEGGI